MENVCTAVRRRIYQQRGDTANGLTNLHAVKTELMDSGEIHVGRPPAENVLETTNDKMKMNKMCSQTIDLLRKSQHSAWHGIQDLVFRFDVVLDGDKVYLNGIDLFPLAESFLDECITCEMFF